MKRGRELLITLTVLALLIGCAGVHHAPSVKPATTRPPKAAVVKKPPALALMGYTIQVGAFSNVNNAARLTESLKRQGLDAYYFLYQSTWYKVRFGNFTTDAAARSRAESLKKAGIIGDYFIVAPKDYAAAHEAEYGAAYIRKSIVETAESFLGVPYLWGGTTPENGFDCSGLAMAVYEYNGFALPRTSQEQFASGLPITTDELQAGDLVFFSGNGNGKVTHVGIYTGNGKFIHAPGRGKVICSDALSRDYFARRFTGARSYLD